ncbi:MAG: IS982 family transposase [Patescibacteria group bacterium]
MIESYIAIYENLKTIVSRLCGILNSNEREHPKGRKPILSNSEAITCALFWRKENIGSKQGLHDILKPSCSYNRFVVALNRIGIHLARVSAALLQCAAKMAHPVKFTDSTDIPVCLNKNGKAHRTMRGLAEWSKTGKGWFYGLKLHLSGDAKGAVLALRLTPGNSDDRSVFRKMNERLRGLFIADAGYISEELARAFFIERERLLLTGSRANMKKVATPFQIALLNLRMRVEIHFRVLKVCYGLVTSLPRSIDGYLTHYLAAIAAYLLA